MNLKYKEDTFIAEQLNKVKNIVNQLTSMKISLDDELQSLSSIYDSWETLVVSLSNSTPDDKVSVSTITSHVLNEEARQQSLGTS